MPELETNRRGGTLLGVVSKLLIGALRPVAHVRSQVRHRADRLRLRKLMASGLRVGKNVYIMEDVEFDLGYPYLIDVGANCRISKGVRILAHDATTFRDLGVTRLAPVRILDGTFIGERALILPGVTIGPNALIAAGSVVNRDIGEGRVAAGNPARPYASFEELLERYRDQVPSKRVILKEDMEAGRVTPEQIRAFLQEDSIAFVRGVPRRDPFYVNTDLEALRAESDRNFRNTMASRRSQESDEPAEDSGKQ